MKHKQTLPFNWNDELENMNVYSIGDDLLLLDKPVIASSLQYPFKLDVTIAIIAIKGTTESKIRWWFKKYAVIKIWQSVQKALFL